MNGKSCGPGLQRRLMWVANTTKRTSKMSESEQEIMTIKDLAAYLRLSNGKVWAMARYGTLPHFRADGRRGMYLFRRADIVAWVASQVEGSINE